jgi:hypothetical protein
LWNIFKTYVQELSKDVIKLLRILEPNNEEDNDFYTYLNQSFLEMSI